MATNVKETLSLREAARVVGVHYVTMGDMVRDRIIRAIDVRRAHARRATWRIDRAELDRFLERRSTTINAENVGVMLDVQDLSEK